MAEQLSYDDLTEEQRVWAAQVQLAAAMNLWGSLPAEERQELTEEILETYDDAHLFAYSVVLVEALGFAVEVPQGVAQSEADTPIGQYL